MNIIATNKFVFLLAFCLSIILSCCAYFNPFGAIGLIYCVSVITSFLLGGVFVVKDVVFKMPIIINKRHYDNVEELKRMERILQKDNCAIAQGQNILFWVYSLILCLSVVYHIMPEISLDQGLIFKIIAAMLSFCLPMVIIMLVRFPLFCCGFISIYGQ
jgi:hypothetical protein